MPWWDEHFDANSICFFFAPVLPSCSAFSTGAWRDLLPQNGSLSFSVHPEVASEKPGSGINEMVIYSFHYVGQRLGAFPALIRAFRSRNKNFLLSSTEV